MCARLRTPEKVLIYSMFEDVTRKVFVSLRFCFVVFARTVAHIWKGVDLYHVLSGNPDNIRNSQNLFRLPWHTIHTRQKPTQQPNKEWNCWGNKKHLHISISLLLVLLIEICKKNWKKKKCNFPSYFSNQKFRNRKLNFMPKLLLLTIYFSLFVFFII